MKATRVVVAISAALLLGTVHPAAAGPSKNGKAVAYAKVDLNTPSVLSFGGPKITAASAMNAGGPGSTDVTFTGKFPTGVTPDQVILQATCESGAYCVSNADVISVDATTLVVYVAGFVSNTTTSIGNRAFLTVFIGQ